MGDSNPKDQDTRWLGFDLGGTKMLATVFDDDFHILGKKRRRTHGDEKRELGVDRIAQTIEQALQNAKVDVSQLRGIGVGCPGPVDLERGVVLEAVNLAWKDLNLRDALQAVFHCPVAVLNDVDAGVYGENQLGAARQSRTVLGIFPGTGIGGGCVYDGQIIRGRRSSAMEIGHVEVTRGGSLCGCGHRGCLETEASRLAISAEIAKAVYRGEAPYLARSAGTDISRIRSSTLADAIAAGDRVVERIVRKAAAQIGVAVANAVHLIAPDTVVLGGGLVEAMPQLFVAEVTQAANDRVMPSFVGSFQVVVAELGDYASAKGAAAWIRNMVRSGRVTGAEEA